VALDVTDPEPLPLDHPLRLMANVIVTPHVAGPTTDDLPRLGEAAVAEVGRVLRGEPPMHAITATDYDRMSF
jgi:phosphoglycerate dehydrogenase-like enzyme